MHHDEFHGILKNCHWFTTISRRRLELVKWVAGSNTDATQSRELPLRNLYSLSLYSHSDMHNHRLQAELWTNSTSRGYGYEVSNATSEFCRTRVIFPPRIYSGNSFVFLFVFLWLFITSLDHMPRIVAQSTVEQVTTNRNN